MTKEERILSNLKKVSWENGFIDAWKQARDAIDSVDRKLGNAFFDSQDAMIFDADIAFEYASDDEQDEEYDGIKSIDIDPNKIYCYGWGDGLTECTEEQARAYYEWMLEYFA